MFWRLILRRRMRVFTIAVGLVVLVLLARMHACTVGGTPHWRSLSTTTQPR